MYNYSSSTCAIICTTIIINYKTVKNSTTILWFVIVACPTLSIPKNNKTVYVEFTNQKWLRSNFRTKRNQQRKREKSVFNFLGGARNVLSSYKDIQFSCFNILFIVVYFGRMYLKNRIESISNIYNTDIILASLW